MMHFARLPDPDDVVYFPLLSTHLCTSTFFFSFVYPFPQKVNLQEARETRRINTFFRLTARGSCRHAISVSFVMHEARATTLSRSRLIPLTNRGAKRERNGGSAADSERQRGGGW